MVGLQNLQTFSIYTIRHISDCYSHVRCKHHLFWCIMFLFKRSIIFSPFAAQNQHINSLIINKRGVGSALPSGGWELKTAFNQR